MFVILKLFWFLKLIWIVNRWGLSFCFISRVWTHNLVNLINFTSTVFVLYFLFLINNKSYEQCSTKIKDFKMKDYILFSEQNNRLQWLNDSVFIDIDSAFKQQGLLNRNVEQTAIVYNQTILLILKLYYVVITQIH